MSEKFTQCQSGKWAATCATCGGRYDFLSWSNVFEAYRLAVNFGWRVVRLPAVNGGKIVRLWQCDNCADMSDRFVVSPDIAGDFFKLREMYRQAAQLPPIEKTPAPYVAPCPCDDCTTRRSAEREAAALAGDNGGRP
jgi:hypothetical protein